VVDVKIMFISPLFKKEAWLLLLYLLKDGLMKDDKCRVKAVKGETHPSPS